VIESYIAPELAGLIDNRNLFNRVREMQGETFRQLASRRTIKTRIAGEFYFAKIHFSVGWAEIFKNLLQGRLPVLGAANEWIALNRLADAGVPTMKPVLFYRERKPFNPAAERSVIVTEALENKISLEDFSTADPLVKRRLLRRIAVMAREMHRAGINHRDFYLCHFLMDTGSEDNPVLHLIDLHRAQTRSRVPQRWLVKDLGGLLFSAFGKALTRRDLLRFMAVYRDRPLREILESETVFWRQVRARAVRLYLQSNDRLPDGIPELLGAS
jgi:heptose I phosphotransferase